MLWPSEHESKRQNVCDSLANSQFNKLINILLSPSGATGSEQCARSKGHGFQCLEKWSNFFGISKVLGTQGRGESTWENGKEGQSRNI